MDQCPGLLSNPYAPCGAPDSKRIPVPACGSGHQGQSRSLNDGSTHRVLKNFPTEAQLQALAKAGLGTSCAYRRWQYYWAFEYRVPEP